MSIASGAVSAAASTSIRGGKKIKWLWIQGQKKRFFLAEWKFLTYSVTGNNYWLLIFHTRKNFSIKKTPWMQNNFELYISYIHCVINNVYWLLEHLHKFIVFMYYFQFLCWPPPEFWLWVVHNNIKLQL